MKLDFSKNGYSCCALCDEKILFKNQDNTLNIKNYREISYLTSLNSVMTVGFCPSCMDKAKEDSTLFDKISDSVKEGWGLEHEHENWPNENIEKYWKTFKDMRITNFYHGNNDVRS